MTLESAASRASFVSAVAGQASSGTRILLLAPLGTGKSHALSAIRVILGSKDIPTVLVDLFTAASTPEHLLSMLCEAVTPYYPKKAEAIAALAAEGERDRHLSSAALLRLFELLATEAPPTPFVWLVDEVTEIRSLAYFPDLGEVEVSFARALSAARGAVVTSSYLGLARDLFPDFEPMDLPGLGARDLAPLTPLRHDGDLAQGALKATSGYAATLLPVLDDLRETRDLERSLVRLLRPGGDLELLCRRHYEVLLLRSRGYAVSKRAAEVVALGRDLRLTDLFPHIGRTPGASRQYLRWLVEVGLLTQTRKRYNFADPILGLWAGLYLGRGRSPGDDEIIEAVRLHLRQIPPGEPDAVEEAGATPPARRPDRFEEID